MPILRARDPLPYRPTRVLIGGTSGSGKSTLAREVSERAGIPYTEIDALHHGAGWTVRSEFAADVDTLAEKPCWVTEYQYRQVREVLADRADLVVWLDLPRNRVLRQVVRRTVQRRVHRTPMWSGNVEPPFRTFLTDADHIVRWSWRTHHRAAVRVAELATAHPDVVVVRLRSHREVRRWLDGPVAASV